MHSGDHKLCQGACQKVETSTSSTTILPTVNLEPERPKLDLSGYLFKEGTTVQELWILNVKTPVSVSSQ